MIVIFLTNFAYFDEEKNLLTLMKKKFETLWLVNVWMYNKFEY